MVNISPLVLPNRLAEFSAGYPQDAKLTVAKINEIALSMNIAPLNINPALGTGDPAADMMLMRDKINEFLSGASGGSTGATTPATPYWTYLSASRTLSLAHGTLATIELEYSHDGGLSWIQYTSTMQVDDAEHVYGDYIGRVKAGTNRNPSQLALSPKIAAATTSTTPPVGVKATKPSFGTIDDVNNLVSLTSNYSYTEVYWGVEGSNLPAQQLASNSQCAPGNIGGRLFAYVVASSDGTRLQSDTAYTSQAFTIAVAANSAPSVTLDSPQAGQTLNDGDMVVLNATPDDAQGASDIKQVDYFDNGVKFATTTAFPHTVQRALTTGSHSFTAKVYDQAGLTGLSNAIPIGTLSSLKVTLTRSVATVAAGGSVTLAADVTGGAVQYVQFKDSNGKSLGIRNAAPYSASYSPQVAGPLKVIAYAITAAGVTYASNQVQIDVTQAVQSTPALGGTLGRWDATVNQLDASGNWAESTGKGLTLMAQGGAMTYTGTAIKGGGGLITTVDKSFLLSPAAIAAGNDFALITVLQLVTPAALNVPQVMVQTSDYKYGEAGGFSAFFSENYTAGAGDVAMPATIYYADGGTYGQLTSAGDRDVSEALAVLVRISPKNGTVTLQIGDSVTTSTFQALYNGGLLERGLKLAGINGKLQVLHLFSGASDQTLADWLTYYNSRLASAVQPNTLFAKDAQVSRAVFQPGNNPSQTYSTGTTWNLSSDRATLDFYAVNTANGLAVFVDDKYVDTIVNAENVPYQVALGPAGTTRRIRVVAGASQGQNGSENGIICPTLLKVVSPAGGVTAWDVPTYNNKVVFGIFDSIGVGQGPGNSAKNGMFQQLQYARPDIDIFYDGWGNRSWNGGLDNAGGVSVTLDRWQDILSYYPANVKIRAVLEAGTNDYTNPSTSDQVAQDQANFVAAARQRFPQIEFVFITPMERNGEETDYGGGTLATYRTKIAAVQAGTSNSHLIDGPTLLQKGNLADGTHPNPTGSNLAAQKLIADFQNF